MKKIFQIGLILLISCDFNPVSSHVDCNECGACGVNVEIFNICYNIEETTTLLLNNNQLTAVPSEIGQLINLTYIYLQNNLLTEVPTEIESLENLQSLSLYNNQLISIPEEIGQLISLTHLYLQNNQLSMLPETICELPNTQWVNVSNNNLCEEYHYECIDSWGIQNQSNCCEGVNDEGETILNWTECAE